MLKFKLKKKIKSDLIKANLTRSIQHGAVRNVGMASDPSAVCERKERTTLAIIGGDAHFKEKNKIKRKKRKGEHAPAVVHKMSLSCNQVQFE